MVKETKPGVSVLHSAVCWVAFLTVPQALLYSLLLVFQARESSLLYSLTEWNSLLLFWDRVLYVSGLPGIHNITRDDFEFLTHLSLPPKCWDYKHVPHSCYEVLGWKPGPPACQADISFTMALEICWSSHLIQKFLWRTEVQTSTLVMALSPWQWKAHFKLSFSKARIYFAGLFIFTVPSPN